MAFPTIPTAAAGRVLTTTGTTCASGQTFGDLSSLTKNSGDLLIAIVFIYDGNSTNAEFSSWGGGFTEFGDFATTTTVSIGCAYKWSTGSETGTFTVTSADTSTNDYATILLSIPGAHASTPPEAGGYANGTNAAADPGSLNPSGWGTEDTLWIAVAGIGETSTSGTFTGATGAPSTYSDYADTGISADVVGGMEGAVAFLQSAAASVDPGTFTSDTSNSRWGAITIAVRPAPVTHDATGVIVGAGAVVDGAANRFRAHAASGVIVGAGTVVDGAAARSSPTVTHDATGTIVGQGAVVTGSANRFRAHDASGALTGPGSAVAGTASSATDRPSSGSLVGAGSAVTGTSARFRAFDASGALQGSGAAVAGTAARVGSSVEHNTTGDLQGSGASVSGSSKRSKVHDTSGALLGAVSALSGTVVRGSDYTCSLLLPFSLLSPRIRPQRLETYIMGSGSWSRPYEAPLNERRLKTRDEDILDIVSIMAITGMFR